MAGSDLRMGLSCTHTYTNTQVLTSQYDCFSSYDEGVSKAVTPNEKVIRMANFHRRGSYGVVKCGIKAFGWRNGSNP
jgi:hypothetical protein